jgi:chemotaxis protein CheD
MRSKVLGISEVNATRGHVVYTCYGLGSCVGVFITDRLQKISGGAHVPLPFSMQGSDFGDAPKLIDNLLDLFRSLGSNLTYLRAKIAGGANVLDTSQKIGSENAKAVVEHLVKNKVFIAASDLGGSISRTARFNSITGELRISTAKQTSYCL